MTKAQEVETLTVEMTGYRGEKATIEKGARNGNLSRFCISLGGATVRKAAICVSTCHIVAPQKQHVCRPFAFCNGDYRRLQNVSSVDQESLYFHFLMCIVFIPDLDYGKQIVLLVFFHLPPHI